MNLKYENMRSGDIWCTTSNHPLSIGIKVRTWGPQYALSLSKCSHVAIVLEIQGKYFLGEALADGFRITSTKDYREPSWRNYWKQVCYIGRHKEFNEVMHAKKLSAITLDLAYKMPRYDTAGVGDFILPSFMAHQNDSKVFCSEAVSYILRSAGLPDICPDLADGKTSPADIQRSLKLFDITESVLIRRE